jgi:hypothetical protein
MFLYYIILIFPLGCANLKNRNIDGSIIEDEKIDVDNSEGDESSKEDEVEAELLTDESDSDEE